MQRMMNVHRTSAENNAEKAIELMKNNEDSERHKNFIKESAILRI